MKNPFSRKRVLDLPADVTATKLVSALIVTINGKRYLLKDLLESEGWTPPPNQEDQSVESKAFSGILSAKTARNPSERAGEPEKAPESVRGMLKKIAAEARLMHGLYPFTKTASSARGLPRF